MDVHCRSTVIFLRAKIPNGIFHYELLKMILLQLRINPAFRCDSSCLDVQRVNKDKVSMYILVWCLCPVILKKTEILPESIGPNISAHECLSLGSSQQKVNTNTWCTSNQWFGRNWTPVGLHTQKQKAYRLAHTETKCIQACTHRNKIHTGCTHWNKTQVQY